MLDAKTLLFNALTAVPDGDRVASYFAEDGVLELPFLHSVRFPTRYEGREAISKFYGTVGTIFNDFKFLRDDITVLIDTPDQVFAEYVTHPRGAATGRRVHHLFAGRLVAKNGQIKLLRESLNVLASANALNPAGAAAFSPTDEIFSIPPGYRIT